MNVQLARAAVAGGFCGLAYSLLKSNPLLIRELTPYVVATGVTGAFVGASYAAARSRPIVLYTLSVGANFALVSGMFLSLRHVVARPNFRYRIRDWNHAHQASVISGVCTGFLVTALSFRSARSQIVTAVGGGFLGFAGQLGYDWLERWRKRKAFELYYNDDSEDHVVSHVASWDEWIVAWAHGKTRGGLLGERVAELEAEIAEEHKKIKILENEDRF